MVEGGDGCARKIGRQGGPEGPETASSMSSVAAAQATSTSSKSGKAEARSGGLTDSQASTA
jgi:hypothetical protein